MTIVNMVGSGGDEEVNLISLPPYMSIFTTVSPGHYSGYTSYVYASTGISMCVGSKTTVKYNIERYRVQNSNPTVYSTPPTDFMTSVGKWLNKAGAPAGEYTIEISHYSSSSDGAFKTITFVFDGTTVTQHNLTTNVGGVGGMPYLTPSDSRKCSCGVVAISYQS